MHAERIRPVRRPRGEDARQGTRGIAARVIAQNASVGAIEPRNHDQVVASLHACEARSEGFVNHQ
jgi:hypothetical protein